MAIALAQGPAQPANCGVTSVVAFADALDRRLAPAVIAKLIADNSQPEVTMEQLQAIARSADLNLTGFRATLDELAARGGPAIVHLRDPDHFACLVGLDDEWAQFLDGWSPRLTVFPRSWLDKHYTGACLLLDDTPPAGPRAVLAARHSQFKQAEAGVVLIHEFTVSNQGAAPLELRAQSSSCTCTTVGRLVDAVAPGAKATVPVSLRPSPGADHLEHIRLATNDPLCPVLFLSMRVESVPQNLTWAPQELFLGLEPGGRAVTRLRVIGPPDMDLQGLVVEPLAYCDVRPAETDRGERRWIYTLEVSSYGELHCGRHEARLLVTVGIETEQTTFAVPVTLVVTDLARLRPARIVELRLQPGPYEREVVVESLTPLRVPVTGARVEGVPLTVEIDRSTIGLTRLRLSGDLTQGIQRGRLIVELDSKWQPELVLPLTFAVGPLGD